MRTRKIPAFAAGITSSLTALDVALLLTTREAGVWLFALVAAIVGAGVTYHLLEVAGLIGEDEGRGQ